MERDIDQALALHRAGRLEEALAIYQDILRVQPRNFDSLHLSGAIALQTGHPERAARLINEAVAADPNVAVAHNSLGSALLALGRLDEAVACYERALAIRPDYADAQYNRGLALERLRRFDDALKSYNAALAIRPGHSDSWNNRGNALRDLGHSAEALASYDQALAVQPGHAGALCNRGHLLRGLGRVGEALVNLDRALAIAPDLVEAWIGRGNTLLQLRRAAEALASYDRAIELQPDRAETWNDRGNALSELGRLTEAVESYERSLAVRPGYGQACYNLGNVLADLNRLDEALASFDQALLTRPADADIYASRGKTLRALERLDEALASYDRALELNPGLPEAHLNRGNLLRDFGRLREAGANYDRALELRPDYAAARHNRAGLLLQQGDFAPGWQEYEWRWRGSPVLRQRDLPVPIWLGDQDLAGKSILLHGEQGLGDQIQFCRYVPMVKALGATVVLEVAAQLVSLCRTLAGADHVIALGGTLPDFQFHCPLLSLPLAFGTRVDTVPAGIPYLTANPGKAAAWAGRLGAANRPRVGLVWSGGHRPDQPTLRTANRRRNIAFETIAALNLPGVDFFSLQKGEPAETELRDALPRHWAGDNFHDFAGDLTDFSDTAALIANLDLVVSVDTSTAHLTGALGRPVWLLDRFDPCWRWLAGRADSPWYPTMRLYRQTVPGDWDGVVGRVRQDLRRFAPGTG